MPIEGSSALPSPPPVDEAAAGMHARMVLVAAWVVVALGFSAAALSIWLDHQTTLRHARAELANMARAYGEHVDKTVQGADQALRFLRSVYRQQGLALNIRTYLDNDDIIQSDFHQLGIIGPDGYVSHSSMPFNRVDLREREHFKVHATGKSDRLYISKPLLGKVSGKWSIQFTRRVADAEGGFAGVAVLSMAPDYFSRYFEQTSLGDGMVTVLTGTDGFIRARAPMTDDALGTDVRERPLYREAMARGEGVTEQPSAVDGTQRIWAFRTLARHGLIVMTGRAVDDLLAPWRARSLSVLAAVTVASTCVLALALALRRHMRGQAHLLTALHASTLQLREVVATMVEGSTKVAGAGSTMSTSAQQLAIRTDQQGDRLRATSDGVRDVVAQVRAGTDSLGRVDERCAALREQTHGGMAVVARSVEAIEGIAARSREMGEAVAVIESIAFQTNILALNAAVEAARAGDAGRAFAVVAGEVRDLAARSRRSAGEVRALIARAAEQAGTGVAEAAAVRQVLDGIAGGVDVVADQMRAVAGQAQQQSDALAQVMTGLDELAQLTRSNADMVAESVMAAEDMRDHAQRLREVVADIERDLPPSAGPAVAAAPARAPRGPIDGSPQPAVEYF